MKTIEGLNQKIELIEAKNTDAIPPTVKEILLTEISLETSIRGPQAILLQKIGLDIMKAEEKIVMEDAEFELLNTVLKNIKQIRGVPVGFTSVMIGAVQSILGKAKSHNCRVRDTGGEDDVAPGDV